MVERVANVLTSIEGIRALRAWRESNRGALAEQRMEVNVRAGLGLPEVLIRATW